MGPEGLDPSQMSEKDRRMMSGDESQIEEDATKAEAIARAVESQPKMRELNAAVKAAEEIGLPKEDIDNLRADREKLIAERISYAEEALFKTDLAIAGALKSGHSEIESHLEEVWDETNNIGIPSADEIGYFLKERLMKSNLLDPKVPGLTFTESGGMDSGKRIKRFDIKFEGVQRKT